jgi:hypothetical protein
MTNLISRLELEQKNVKFYFGYYVTKFLSEIYTEHCIDLDTNKVYACVNDHKQLFKLLED